MRGRDISLYIYSFFIHFTFVYILNAIHITTNQHIQTNLCIHLSYLEDQKNLKIYNKNINNKTKQLYKTFDINVTIHQGLECEQCTDFAITVASVLSGLS